jgi:carbamoyl-phosphate synthase large subunit
MLNVLITGVGSIIAIGHILSLRASKLKVRITGADISNDAAGLYMCDMAYIVPPIKEEDAYISKIKQICKKEHIDMLIVGSTKEPFILAKHKSEIEKETGAKIIVSNSESLRLSDDKWDTQQFLMKNKLNNPKSTIDLSDANIKKFVSAVGLPVVAKPRKGQNSIGVFIFKTMDEILKNKPKLTNYILQEYLPDEEGEYTVGVLRLSKGVMHTIILKRKLQPRWGVSSVAWPIENEKTKKYCEAVAEKLDIYGPCNFQLRMKNGEPYIFEINCRFSSTAHMRTLLGMNEPEMLLKDFVLKEKVSPPIIKKGTCVRYTDEIFISESQMKQLSNN